MTCFAYAYSDSDGVSVNLFATRAERDEAVRELLSDDFSENDPPPFGPETTAENAWDSYRTSCRPDFYLAFNDM